MKYIFLLLVIVSNRLFSQTYEPTFDACVPYSVVPITYNTTTGTSIGTGTLIIMGKQREKTDSNRIFLITNKHVLPHGSNVAEFVRVKISEKILNKNTFKEISIPIYDSEGQLKPYVHFHKDEDLALIDFTEFFEKYNLGYLKKYLIQYYYLGSIDRLKGNRIRLGTPILFAGFPKHLYDNRNAAPIIQNRRCCVRPTR